MGLFYGDIGLPPGDLISHRRARLLYQHTAGEDPTTNLWEANVRPQPRGHQACVAGRERAEKGSDLLLPPGRVSRPLLSLLK